MNAIQSRHHEMHPSHCYAASARRMAMFLAMACMCIGSANAQFATPPNFSTPASTQTRSSQPPARVSTGFTAQQRQPPQQFPPTDSGHLQANHADPQDSFQAVDRNPVAQVSAETPRRATTQASLREEIETTTKLVNESSELNEEQKTSALKRLRSASDWLKDAIESETRIKEYEAEIADAPQGMAQAKAMLSTPLGDPQVQLPPLADRTYVQQQIEEVKTNLAQAKKRLTAVEESMQQRNDRQSELVKLLANAEQLCSEAKKQVVGTQSDLTLLGVAKRIDAEAMVLALQQQAPCDQLEQKRNNAIADLLPLRRDLAKREVGHLEKSLAAWQQVLRSYRKVDVQRRLVEARRIASLIHPKLKPLAQQIVSLSQQRQELVAEIESLQTEVPQSKKLIESLQGEFSKLSERVEKGGRSATIGLLLRRHREHIPDANRCHARLRFVKEQLPKSQLGLLDLRDTREAMADPEEAFSSAISLLPQLTNPTDQADLNRSVATLLKTQRDTLDNLISENEDYIELLGELEVTQQMLLTHAIDTNAYINERVLWIRSNDPIAPSDVQHAFETIAGATSSDDWGPVVESIRQRLRAQPIIGLAFIAVVFSGFLWRRKFVNTLNDYGSLDRETLALRFSPTLEALLASAVAAAFWPGAAWVFGWQLKLAATTSVGMALGYGMQTAACSLFVCQLARHAFRKQGLCELHFQVSEANCRLILSNITWLASIGVPCVFIATVVGATQNAELTSSIGRLAFITGMFSVALFCHRVFHLTNGVFGDDVESSMTWTRQARRMIYFVGIGASLTLAGVSAIGYDYSAQCIAVRINATLIVSLIFVLAHVIAWRGLDVRQNRNIAKREAEELEQARLAESLSGETPNADTVPPLDHASDDEATDSQMRYLLRHAMVLAIFASGYTIWSDVTPALSILDEVHVWSREVVDEIPVTDDTGTQTMRTVSTKVNTTLKHLVIGSLILCFGFMVARNVPALLQVTVLEHMPLDKGQQYAAGMVFSYGVILASIIFASRTIGLTWGSIQWLAAAMTVGLGFGLQEIFANLVSGLIILFERPIRVGDLVSVGDINGRVTRMQIRATTITSFDRRELIVPNKKFITENVLNWTLSDNINRVVIEVGVAYGSDTKLARELLLAAATEHPLILSDPEPLATMDRFADSSINFTLRCFLPNLDDRLQVIHDLHADIDMRFRSAKVEIAFPQQDLHIRTIDGQIQKSIGLASQEAA